MAEDGYDPRRGAEAVAQTLAACQRPDQRVRRGAPQSHRRDLHAGTTAVAALLVEDHEADKWLLVNLGDSRIYRFNDGVLDQVSVDHSLVQELVDAGVITRRDGDPSGAARRHPRPRRARAQRADFFLLPLPSAERLVLCSDGVTG